MLCWRLAAGRTRGRSSSTGRAYDDWSWPKGKTRPAELLPRDGRAGGRGGDRPRRPPGRPLGQVRYLLEGGRPKEVTYWAAVPTGVDAPENATPENATPEVDGLAWLPVAEARAVLTRAADAAPLDVLEKHAAAGELDTVPLLVVRHGTSRPRDSWAHVDADRPLVSAGRRQARALVPLLACWCPERIVSSPWRRCMETVAPFAQDASLRVVTKEFLSEVGAARSPKRTRRQVERLLDRAQPALLLHPPARARRGVHGAARRGAQRRRRGGAPKDPFLAPGEVLVAHALATGPARVVTVERHQPRA